MILEYLFDTVTLRVIGHLWVAHPFEFEKWDMQKIHKCTREELDKSLAKLTQVGLVEFTKNRKYQFSTNSNVAEQFDEFMITLVSQRMSDAASFFKGVQP